jgi:hypothetical protein
MGKLLIALFTVSSLLGCEVVGAGCGTNPNQEACRSAPRSSGNSSSKSESKAVPAKALLCSSDYDCQYGAKCVKAQFESEGYCAEAVNKYGVPTFSPPDPKSVYPGGPGQCAFDTDCPVLFYCKIEPGQIRGACLKRED